MFLQTSYTDNVWNPLHHPAVAKANNDLADFDAKHSKDKLVSIIIVYTTDKKLYLPTNIFILRCWVIEIILVICS